MYIKSYECKRFAGLKDMELKFKPGINVILGPNESGKSTIIEGIHATLFKDIKLRKNNNIDKDFSFKFMPKPSGDFINGKVVLESGKGQYEIAKEWGSSENIELITPDGNILRDEKDIKDKLNNVLDFGESTYSNIVFAKQRDVKQALFNIINNEEVTQEINDLLRMTLMELDGISIDSIENNIQKQIDDLYKRWDKDKNYPQNNRGINDPYKVGLGKIVESYYKKEKLKLSMEEADKTEKEFERISKDLREVKDQRDVLSKEKLELEKIESDVNNRAVLNAQLGSIDKELEDLMEANREWPKTEQILEQLDEKLFKLKEEKENLSKEQKSLEKINKKENLQAKLKRIKELEAKISTIVEELSKIPPIRKEDITELNNIQKEILTLETTMKAGKMIGILKKSGNDSIYVSKDFGERKELKLNEEFQADGFIQVNYGDDFELEIKTGEIDFEELNNKYISFKEEYKSLLENLNIDNIEIGKLNLEKIQEKEREIKALNRELELVLDNGKKEEIEEELKGLEDIKVFKSLEDIEKELNLVHEEEIDIISDKKTKSTQLKLWEEEYENHDKLFDLVIEKKASHNEKEKELDKLKPLPERFETVDDFKNRLTWLKSELNNLQIELDNLVTNYHEAKNNLTDETYEELKKEHLEAEKIFSRNISRGEKLLEIKEVFLQTKERLDSNPMESLVDEFARLLEIITDGSYKTGDIDEEFNIKLENANGQIPIELLSAGTHDSVTLALRFALLKHIFNDRDGYVVLDDCLVDLDPMRKAQSVKLINDLAEDYQIIFTTCDPETAKMLGGNIIELAK